MSTAWPSAGHAKSWDAASPFLRTATLRVLSILVEGPERARDMAPRVHTSVWGVRAGLRILRSLDVEIPYQRQHWGPVRILRPAPFDLGPLVAIGVLSAEEAKGFTLLSRCSGVIGG